MPSFSFVGDVYAMLEVVSAILKENRGPAEPAKSETTMAKYAYLFGEELSGAVQGEVCRLERPGAPFGFREHAREAAARLRCVSAFAIKESSGASTTSVEVFGRICGQEYELSPFHRRRSCGTVQK